MIQDRLSNVEKEISNEINTINHTKVFNLKNYYTIVDIPLDAHYKNELMKNLPRSKLILLFVTENQKNNLDEYNNLLFDIIFNKKFKEDTMIVFVLENWVEEFDRTKIHYNELKDKNKITSFEGDINLIERIYLENVRFIETRKEDKFSKLKEEIKILLI